MWNLIFGDDEDSLDPQDEGTKEEVENLKENVSKVETVPTHQFASGKFESSHEEYLNDQQSLLSV